MAIATATALAVGGGLAAAGIAGQAIAGSAAAGAEERAGLAQIEAQRRQRQEALEAAEPSAAELAALERQQVQTERAIERQEKLLSAVDPALIEAGKQALGLLEGRETGTLAPLRRERERQRQELESRLRRQLGSGFETSSAGIEALSRFDEETAGLQAQEQQRALGTLLGTSLNTRQLSGAGFEGAQAFGNIVGQQRASRGQRLSAILGTPIGSEDAVRERASAERARGLGQLAGGVAKIGGIGLGLGAGGLVENPDDNFLSSLDGGTGLNVSDLSPSLVDDIKFGDQFFQPEGQEVA